MPYWIPNEHGNLTVDDVVLDALRANGREIKPNTKVYLGAYLKVKNGQSSGGGVCAHQALLVAHLMERLKEEGLVKGTISFERNQLLGDRAHAWVRHTDDKGEKWVIDPAQDHFGWLVDEAKWEYRRSKDLDELKQQGL